MARIARLTIPNLPHHVTQRGNRRETVFFSNEDYQAYIDLLAAFAKQARTQVWAWCLMPNHVHLILVPSTKDGLRRTLAGVHRRYAARINSRNKWTGHLWQGRYGSVVMDEEHLYRAIAYVTLNPVRAGLVRKPEKWKWSSVHAHLAGEDDALTTVRPVLSRVGDFAGFLKANFNDEDFEPLRRAEIVGRPVGADAFIEKLEKRTRRKLKPKKRGPRPKSGK